MSFTEATHLEAELCKLECHFTWELKKEELDLTDLLNRLEQHAEFNLGGEAGLAQTYNSLGFVKYLLGSPQDALAFLQKCVELTRKCRENDCDKFSRKYYNKAKECFEKALALEPKNAEWNCGYAFVLHRTEGQCSSVTDSPAIKQLRQAIDTNLDNYEIKALLAVRLGQCKEYDEAQILVEEVLEGSPNAPNVIRYVGKYLRDYDSVEMSIGLLKRALEKSPASAFIHHQLALCYKRKTTALQHEGSQNSTSAGIKRLRSQCIYHLDKATELKPGFIIAMTELANQYSEDGKLDRAEELFQQTLQIAKEKNEGLQQVYFSYGQFQQYRMRSLPDAITCYMECLKIDEDTTDGKKSAKQMNKINARCSSKSPGKGNVQRTYVRK